MARFLVLPSAEDRIGELYRYTLETWGKAQADRYVHALYDQFQKIADRRVLWLPIPPEMGVEGYFARHKRHRIYWSVLSSGDIGIRTVLHERMDLPNRLKQDFDA